MKYCVWCLEPEDTQTGCPSPDGDGHLFSLTERPRRLIGAPMGDLCVKEDWFENEADFHDFIGLD